MFCYKENHGSKVEKQDVMQSVGSKMERRQTDIKGDVVSSAEEHFKGLLK